MHTVSKYHIILSVFTFVTEDYLYNVFLLNYASWFVGFLFKSASSAFQK